MLRAGTPFRAGRRVEAGRPRPFGVAPIGLLIFFLLACQRPAAVTDHAAAARELFERTVRECHLTSAEKQGAEKAGLLEAAARGYQDLLRRYPDQPFWCAQAVRSLANVRVEQGRPDEAVTLYRQVGMAYPQCEWEVVQAWKSAGDLLWDAGRQAEAREFYRLIVGRFDRPDAAPVVQSVVKGAQARLGPGAVAE